MFEDDLKSIGKSIDEEFESLSDDWVNARQQIIAMNARLTALESPAPPPPLPPQFQPMTQFMGQVNGGNSSDMKEFIDAGWTGGFHAYTNQITLETWLKSAALVNRPVRLSGGADWLVPQNRFDYELAIKQHADIIYGIEFEGAPDVPGLYRTVAAELGEHSYLLSGYQENGSDVTDQHCYLWYPREGRGNPNAVGKLKVTTLDPLPTYPAHLQQTRHANRTADNRPVRGVKTGCMWLQVSGYPIAGLWPEISKDRYFIKPNRSDMYTQLLISHYVLRCNQVCWYSNGSREFPGRNLPSYDPKQFADLQAVIKAYETQTLYESWGEYWDRNPKMVAL